ncbi:hypothetical protein ACVXHB_19930 [Escherichia coli]
MIFDWDEYSLDLCSDINQLNEYLPLYAFITPTRRWMSACRICGWRSGFLNMRWGRRKISPFVCVIHRRIS